MRVTNHILVLDKSPTVAQFFAKCLGPQGHEVLAVSTPAEALKKAKEDGVDLVFLDAGVLGHEGVEITKKLKNDEATKMLPVVWMVASEEARDHAAQAGCADVVLKPLDQTEVLAKVEAILSLHAHREELDEKSRSDEVLDAMADGIVITDANLRVSRLNEKAKDFLGISLNGVPVPFLEAVRKVFKVHYEGNLEKDILEKPLVFDLERPQTDKARPLILETRTSVARNSFREKTGVVAALADVTDRRQKSFQEEQFLNFISHKLRTPLSIVHKNAQLFHKKVLGPLSTDQEKFMGVLYEKCSELVDSFEKLLGFNLLKTKKLELTPDTVLLADALPAVFELFSKRALAKRLEWLVHAEPLLAVDVNRRYFDMLLNNLIENAVKFSSEDVVTVNVRATPADGQRVEFVFSDNGPGVPPEELEKIFEPFYQVDKHRTMNIAGTGLGLAIVKSIVTLYGGKIAAKNGEHGGLIFSFTLPRKP